MTDLSQLLEKVRTAEAGSRELDAEFAATLKAGSALPDWARKWSGEWRPTIQGSVVLMEDDGRPGPHFTAHFYTTSLDAIVALIERELPEWSWQTRKTGYAELNHPTHHLRDEVEHGRTPALALCAVFISVLITKEKADG